MSDQRQIAVDGAEVEELRRIIASLRQSEGRFAKAFYSSADALIISRLADGAILEINPSYERVLGYEAAELIGKDRRTLQLAVDLAARDRLIQRLTHDGFYRDEEIQLRQRSGTLCDVRISAETFDIGGELCVLARIRDITEQKETERALSASDERLRMALTAARMGIWEWDIAGDRVVWSGEASAIFGLASEEAVRTFGEFLERVHPDDRPRIGERIAALVELAQAEISYDEEHRIVTSAGEVRWVAAKGKVLFDEAGQPVRMLGTVTDATERKLAEDKAQRDSSDLWRMSRIRTADQMASSMAHELNQPLAAIALQAGIAASLAAASRERIPPELAVALDEISQQSQRAGGIIRSLRDFVKRADPSRGRVQLNEVVREVIRLVEAVAREHQVRIAIDLDELPTVEGDRIQIAQVLLNLLQNALDAVRDRQTADRLIEVATRIVGRNSVELVVTDNGPGVRPDIGEQIFERFYTTKSGGIGLGLALSRSIAEAHGGKLWFESRDGQGAAFHMSLPLGAVELRS